MPLDIAKSIRELPPLPDVVVELLASMDKDNVGSKDLGDKIARDQALSAKALRLANSSFYGMQRKVTTIQQATAILGINAVRTIVTAAGVIGAFGQVGGQAFDIRAFWRHSIATALCAKAMARHVQVNAEQAFMVGLLHDIGRLVLLMHDAARYQQVLDLQRSEDLSVVDAERRILGMDHTEAGRSLGEFWKFPLMMVRAIEQHHQPEHAESGSLAPLVHLCDACAHGLDLINDEQERLPRVSDVAWRAIRPAPEWMLKVFEETEAQFEDACQILTG